MTKRIHRLVGSPVVKIGHNFVVCLINGTHLVIQDASTGREEIIKQHLTSRLADMSAKLQQAESKTLSFHAEV